MPKNAKNTRKEGTTINYRLRAQRSENFGFATRKTTSVAMLGSRVGSGSQKSRSSQKDSSTGTTPTQKTRDIAVITVNAGEIGRKWGGREKAEENEIDGM